MMLVGIVTVATWTAVGVSLITSRQHALDDARSEGRNMMIAFREQLALILRGVEGEMNLIAERMRHERGSFDLYEWSQQEVLVSPGMAQATIIDPDGKLRQTTIDRHPGSIDLSDRAHFRVHLNGGFHGFYVGRPGVTELTGEAFLPISRRVDAEDGTFLGVLAMLISPGALTTLHKSIDLGPHGVIDLSGLDHRVLARYSADSPDGIKGVGRLLKGRPVPDDVNDNMQGDYVWTSPLDGITRVCVYGRVGSYPLIVTVGLELDRKLATWRSYAAVIVAMAFGGTLLLIGFAAYLIRQILHDASVARATTVAIAYAGEHDFLTGLPNRVLLDDRINRAIAVAQRHKNKVAVLFLDLDGFKHINDSLGHPIGDQLLQSVAKRLTATVRGSDTISRLGGDEFVAVVSDVSQPKDAAIAASKMLQAVAEAHPIGQHNLHVTASIGVSIYPDNGADAETLIKNADIALYRAKENGRQCYRFFTSMINARAIASKSVTEDLRLVS